LSFRNLLGELGEKEDIWGKSEGGTRERFWEIKGTGFEWGVSI